MSSYKTGDIVRLKSGSPKMTVKHVDAGDSIVCQWFDRNGKIHADNFPVAMLESFVVRERADSDSRN